MNKRVITVIFLIATIGIIFFLIRKRNNSISTAKIKIGVVLPLSGPVAEPGKNVLSGIQISVNAYNDTTKNKKIELIIEDSKSNPKDGVSAFKKLVEVDKAQIVIGDIMSSVFLAMAPIAEKEKVLLISPGASNPAVTSAGDYIFRDYTSDNYDGVVMAGYIYAMLKKKRTAVAYVNNDYGVGVKDAFIAEYEKKGGTISAIESYAGGQTDLRTIARKLKESQPECIYIVGNPAENGYLVKELKTQDSKAQITGNLSFEDESFYKIAGTAYDSIIFSSPYFNITSTNAYTRNFVFKFREKYDKDPSVEAALGYDVGGILIKALADCEYNVKDIKDAMYRVQNFEGVTGNTSFDVNGDVKKTILIKSIKKDKTVKIISNYLP